MTKTVGIDLGTTNTCVAIAEGFEARVVPNYQGYRTTPSMVARNTSGKTLVGHLAKRQAVTNPGQTIYAAKRMIGRRFNSAEIQKAQKQYPFQIVEGNHSDVRVQFGEELLSPQEIAALILRDVCEGASDSVGEKIAKAIITVPAYFNDNQRKATKDAGEIAGIEVVRVINEPTAACIAYGMGQKKNETVVVYDFGGGTFDVSIINIDDSVYEVLATSGDSYLGGEDIDNAIIEYFYGIAKDQYGLDLSNDPLAMQRLKIAAEEAKHNLSFQEVENVVLPFLAQGADGKPVNFETSLSRAQLEDLARPFIERSIAICENTLELCGLGLSDIDNVLLVGGQTRMPLVQEAVSDYFLKQPRKGINPDEVVALGAAIEANVLEENQDEMLLLDVTPLDLGIATQGDIFSSLIDRNTRVPVKKAHVFTTVKDNQDTVKLQVFQGNENRASANELLGEFSLTGIRAAGRGEPRIEVVFNISSDGTVSVSARDLDTGASQQIDVNSSSQLSETEVRDMIKRNAEYAVNMAD